MGLAEARALWEQHEAFEFAGRVTIGISHANAMFCRRASRFEEADWWRQRAEYLESMGVHWAPSGHPVVLLRSLGYSLDAPQNT